MQPQQAREKIDRQVGHVARHDQGPVSPGCAERGENAPEGATVSDGILNQEIAQVGIAVPGSDQRHISSGEPHAPGHMVDQRRAVALQKCLIAAHPGAPATDQHESPDARRHEKMITYAWGRYDTDTIGTANKNVYIWFLLAGALLAATSVCAADAPPQHKTLVVRADPRTGRLVRSVIVSRVPAPPVADISAMVEQSARAHDVDPLLVHSMIKVESNYNSHAVSAKGAEGLMQLMPSTARMLGVGNSFDPQENIEAGVKYLSYLKSVYKDDRLALAAYNAGPGAVDKYKMIPPYRETENYLYQVGKHYGEARRAVAAQAPVPEPAPAPAPSVMEEKHPKLEQFVDENGRVHLRTTP